MLHGEFYHPFKEEIKPVCIKHLQKYNGKKYLKGKYYSDNIQTKIMKKITVHINDPYEYAPKFSTNISELNIVIYNW